MISVLGCGFLGLPLVRFFLECGHAVKGSARKEKNLLALKKVGVPAYKIELTSRGIHGDSSFFDCDILIVNVPPGKTADVAERHPKEISQIFSYLAQKTKVVFVSSTSVYPNLEKHMDETFPLDERIESELKRSGKALRTIEKTLLNLYPKRVCILRAGGLIGGERHPGRFLADKKNIAGAHQPVNLVHRDDLVKAIATVVSEKKWGAVFNLVMPDHPRREEVYQKAAQALGLNPPLFNSTDKTGGKTIDGRKIEKKTAFRYAYRSPFNIPLTKIKAFA